MPVRSYSSASASVRNLCPSGTGVGYITFNDTNFGNTIFLVCDAAFNINTGEVDLGLALGLGLGLGIPFLCLFACLIYQKCCSHAYYEPRASLIDILRIKPAPRLDIPSLSVNEKIRGYLTDDALADFNNGNLSELLKEEIMMVRVREGRNLTEFVTAAKGWPEIATWIENLHPGSIPPAIRQEAILKAGAVDKNFLVRADITFGGSLEGGYVAPTTKVQVRPAEEV